jgi:hypothetical protein
VQEELRRLLSLEGPKERSKERAAGINRSVGRTGFAQIGVVSPYNSLNTKVG